MRYRLILAILIFAGLTAIPASLLGQRGTDRRHQLSVRQQVDLELLNLQKNVTAAGTQAEGLHYLEKTLARIKYLREAGPTQWSQDEFAMDRMAGSLEEISRSSALNKVNYCESVRARLLRLYDPRALSRSEDPTLQGSLSIWSEICHKKN